MESGDGMFEGSNGLEVVEHRGRWIASGLVLQILGAGIPALIVVLRAKHDSVVGQIGLSTVRLAGHEVLRSRTDAELIVAGIALFVAGAILLARPFVRRKATLLVAVPVAATVGVLVLGVAALLGAIAIAITVTLADAGDFVWLDVFDWSDGKRRRKNDRPTDSPS